MKDISAFLLDIDNQLRVIRNKDQIDKSIEYLTEKIWGLFQEKLHSVTVFGSFDRETFINGDPDADVDIAIIFKKNDLQPQTYLDKIKTFCETKYPRSDIYPDHPTIVIEMNHIKFELVPAYTYSENTLKIPAPRSKDLKWISTNPKDFKLKLTEKDKANKNFISPVIRILKYWNGLNGKLLSSYEIEKCLVNRLYTCSTLKDYFFSAVTGIEELIKTEAQKKCYLTLKEKCRRLRVLEREKFLEYIEAEIASILPAMQN